MIDLPTTVGAVGVISGALLGWFGYRRAVKVDNKTEGSAVVAARSGEVSQIIEGLNLLIDNLQKDNRIWRENFASITIKLTEVVKERDELQLEVHRLYKKYGIDDEVA